MSSTASAQPLSHEEMEDFLEQVEEVSKTVQGLKDGTISLEELDKKDVAKKIRKQREQEKEERKLIEAQELKKKGRFGKGEGKDYVSFCKYCFREFEIEMPKCSNCAHDTQTQAERHVYLQSKLGEYKHNKLRRQERKKKWELWQKTQAMLWKKTSTNYSKWDNFTSSSEEEDEKNDPIVPKNDPNFRALEMDIEQRAKKRKEDRYKTFNCQFLKRAKAEELKLRGNQKLKEGDFEKALLWYSEALDICKDNLSLYTNRALAYIKLEYFKKAIKDCTRVLEYCECFEDGYTKSKELCFKAFIRRALAQRARKNVREAREDVQQCLLLIPGDKDALMLLEEIKQQEAHLEDARQLAQKKNKVEAEQKSEAGTQQVEEISTEEKVKNLIERVREESKPVSPEAEKKQYSPEEVQQLVAQKVQELEKVVQEKEKVVQEKELSFMQVIDAFLEGPVDKLERQAIECVEGALASNKEARVYLYERKGLARVLEALRAHKRVYLLISILLKDNVFYQSEFLRQGGTKLLHETLDNLVRQATSGAQQDVKQRAGDQFDEAEDVLEVLCNLSLTENLRDVLKDDADTIEIVDRQWDVLLPLFRRETRVVGSYLIYVSNLCYQQSKYKQHMDRSLEKYLKSLYEICRYEVRVGSSSGLKYESLREKAYNILTNFLVEEGVRSKFQRGDYRPILEAIVQRMSSYDVSKNPAILDAAQSAASIFVNLAFSITPASQQMLGELQLGEVLLGRFVNKLDHTNEAYKDLLNRCLQVLAKLDYSQPTLLQRGLLKTISRFFDEISIARGFASHAVRIWFAVLQPPGLSQYLLSNEQANLRAVCPLLKHLILTQDEEQKFCNSCTVAGAIVLLSPQLQSEFYGAIERLVTVCKERIGLQRKNAAQLLGKLGKDEKNLQKIRDLHGIEILQSILSQVVK